MLQSRRKKLFDPLMQSLSRSRKRNKSKGIKVTSHQSSVIQIKQSPQPGIRNSHMSPIHNVDTLQSTLRSNSPQVTQSPNSTKRFFQSFHPLLQRQQFSLSKSRSRQQQQKFIVPLLNFKKNIKRNSTASFLHNQNKQQSNQVKFNPIIRQIKKSSTQTFGLQESFTKDPTTYIESSRYQSLQIKKLQAQREKLALQKQQLRKQRVLFIQQLNKLKASTIQHQKYDCTKDYPRQKYQYKCNIQVPKQKYTNKQHKQNMQIQQQPLRNKQSIIKQTSINHHYLQQLIPIQKQNIFKSQIHSITTPNIQSKLIRKNMVKSTIKQIIQKVRQNENSDKRISNMASSLFQQLATLSDRVRNQLKYQ